MTMSDITFLVIGGFIILVVTVPIIIYVSVESYKTKKYTAEYLESDINLDAINIGRIEPIYVELANVLTTKQYEREYRQITTPDIIINTTNTNSNAGIAYQKTSYSKVKIGGVKGKIKNKPVRTYSSNYGSSISTTVQRGGYTQEYLEDVATLCRKFRGWTFDKYDNVLGEFKETFRGKKNKDFEDIVINYLSQKLANEETDEHIE